MNYKKMIRAAFLEKRNNVAYREIQEKSSVIIQTILNRNRYQQAKQVFTYLGVGSEVMTAPLIERAPQDGKEVMLPVAAKNRLLYFLNIKSLQGLKKTRMGLLEPVGDYSMEVKPMEEALFIVPVVGFDKGCGRIGYGGGYYDTYFSQNAGIYKMGIAFEFTKVESIPLEPHDFVLDEIITEKQSYYNRRG